MEVGEEGDGLEGVAQAVLAAPGRAPGSQRGMKERCMRDSPHRWDKIPEKKELKEGRVYFGSQIEATIYKVSTVWPQELVPLVCSQGVERDGCFCPLYTLLCI